MLPVKNCLRNASKWLVPLSQLSHPLWFYPDHLGLGASQNMQSCFWTGWDHFAKWDGVSSCPVLFFPDEIPVHRHCCLAAEAYRGTAQTSAPPPPAPILEIFADFLLMTKCLQTELATLPEVHLEGKNILKSLKKEIICWILIANQTFHATDLPQPELRDLPGNLQEMCFCYQVWCKNRTEEIKMNKWIGGGSRPHQVVCSRVASSVFGGQIMLGINSEV